MQHLTDYSDAYDAENERIEMRNAMIGREADAIIADKDRLTDVVADWLYLGSGADSAADLLAALYASECLPAPSWAKDDLPRMIRQLGLNLYQAVTEAAADSVDAKMRQRHEGSGE